MLGLFSHAPVLPCLLPLMLAGTEASLDNLRKANQASIFFVFQASFPPPHAPPCNPSIINTWYHE